MRRAIQVGCAGWNLPQAERWRFPADGDSLLARYAERLPAVEINSSFYRPHRPATYARWRASVPSAFLFSVKMPREITHRLRLKATEAELDVFLPAAAELGEKLGCLLLQMPPGLAFDRPTVERFCETLRERHAGEVAAEPRHLTWFTPEADRILDAFRIGRVAADPPRAPGDGEPGGWPGIVYYRLHGSPKIYYSSYSPNYLKALALQLKARTKGKLWCIFDNTALGAATANAFELLKEMNASG